MSASFGGRLVTLMTQLDWTERLHEIRCPTLIARPGLANIGSGEQYEEMHRRIPVSQLVTYEGLPHHLTDAAPERCVDDVLAFLRWRFGAA